MKNELPHSVEMEQGVLGSMMLAPKIAIPEAVKKVNEQYFYIPAHQTIYVAMVEMWNDGKEIDLMILTQALRDKGVLDTVGGASFVTSLYTFVPSASNIDYYLESIRDKYILRETIAACTEGARRAYEQQDEVDSLLSDIQGKLLAVTSGEFKEEKTIMDYAMGAMDELEEIYQNKGQKMRGLSTGLKDLDRKLGGLRPKQLVIVAGPTGGGKTALAMKIAAVNAVHNDIPVGVISLEMSGEELSERLIGLLGRVDMHTFSTTGGTESDLPKIADAVRRISESKLIICDESDIDLSRMRAIAREMKRVHKIQLLVVDYIQLLIATSTKDDNRERAMANAAAACKQMAKELGIPVIAGCQLNDDGKLRESRAIGHHADKVIVIEHSEDEIGEAFANVDKNRGGPKGQVQMTWIDKYTDFVDYADGTTSPIPLFGYGKKEKS